MAPGVSTSIQLDLSIHQHIIKRREGAPHKWPQRQRISHIHFGRRAKSVSTSYMWRLSHLHRADSRTLSQGHGVYNISPPRPKVQYIIRYNLPPPRTRVQHVIRRHTTNLPLEREFSMSYNNNHAYLPLKEGLTWHDHTRVVSLGTEFN